MRRRPGDDLLSSLAETRESDDRLTDDEVVSTAILLFAAGFETTTNLLGNGLLALLTHPDQLEDWRTHPEIAPTAVEELLRFDSPVQFNLRTALEPAELVGDPLVRGDRVVVLQGAANRDPSRFEDPDALDMRRADNVPMSFGWGVHHCIGAPLARMEGEIAFDALSSLFGHHGGGGGSFLEGGGGGNYLDDSGSGESRFSEAADQNQDISSDIEDDRDSSGGDDFSGDDSN